jgi:hypothetical protein
MTTRLTPLILSLSLIHGTPAAAGSSSAEAAPRQSTNHAAMAMGFDQDKTTHHFLLFTDGGAIDISVKDAGDRANLDAIRGHLPHITQMFGDGNFSAPMLVHDRTDVPGTSKMAQLKDRIRFRYAETPRGGRVDIVTSDADALAALHEFLRFQITDHKTGDPLTPRRR